MIERERIIAQYIEGYNSFDTDKMTEHMDQHIVFENISNGEINMYLAGLDAFKEQAEKSKNIFSTRTQTLRSYKHQADETEIEIDYSAILAIDFPNGLKKGDEIKLLGKSVFKFSNKKIVKLIDIS